MQISDSIKVKNVDKANDALAMTDAIAVNTRNSGNKQKKQSANNATSNTLMMEIKDIDEEQDG